MLETLPSTKLLDSFAVREPLFRQVPSSHMPMDLSGHVSQQHYDDQVKLIKELPQILVDPSLVFGFNPLLGLPCNHHFRPYYPHHHHLASHRTKSAHFRYPLSFSLP